MAMKDLMVVTLEAKHIREACEAYVERQINDPNVDIRAQRIEQMSITVTVSKRRAPRKPRANGNGVASSGKLSEQEEHFG